MSRIRFVKILRYLQRPTGPKLAAPTCEPTLGLLPFSDVCLPELTPVRRCPCGNWVEDGNETCPSCGAPAPQGPTTRAWKRVQVQLQQSGLNPADIPSQMEIPEGVNPDSYLAEIETHDYDVDWEANDGQRD